MDATGTQQSGQVLPQTQSHQEFTGDLNADLNEAPLRIEIQHTDEERKFVVNIDKNINIGLERDQSHLDDMVRLGIISEDLAKRTRSGELTFEENIEVNALESIVEECRLLLDSDSIDGARLAEILEALGSSESKPEGKI